MTTKTVDDSDQRVLRTTARDFFEKYSDESAVRSAMETDEGFDRALWSRMADELGLQGLLVPDRFGGNELGFVQLQIVMEEMGRALVCAPFLSSAVLSVAALATGAGASVCGPSCWRADAAIANPKIVAAKNKARAIVRAESGMRFLRDITSDASVAWTDARSISRGLVCSCHE